jgi:hypothetical protein
MYYNVMTMTVMVILYCFLFSEEEPRRSLRSELSTVDSAPRAHGKQTSTCSHDVWNIDMELGRTRFHCSMIFHKWTRKRKGIPGLRRFYPRKLCGLFAGSLGTSTHVHASQLAPPVLAPSCARALLRCASRPAPCPPSWCLPLALRARSSHGYGARGERGTGAGAEREASDTEVGDPSKQHMKFQRNQRAR